MSIRKSQEVKKLDTLIEDIYDVLDKLNTDEGIDIDEDLLEDFLVGVRGAIKSWSTPKLQNKALRMSNIGRPMRRIWFDMQEEEQDRNKHSHPSTFVKFLYGHLLEELAILFIKMAGHTVTDTQKEVEIDGIKGHMDCKIDGEVVDIKTASGFAFKKFSEGTLPDNDPFGYLAQLAGYEQAEGTEDGGFFAINKETGELCLYRPGNLSKPNISNRISTIKDVITKDEPPIKHCYQPVAEGTKGNMRLASGCVYCPHKTKCWDDLRAFKYATGLKYFTTVKSLPRVEEVAL